MGISKTFSAMNGERKESKWLCKNIGDDFTVDVGQAKVSSLAARIEAKDKPPKPRVPMPRSFLRFRELLSSKMFSMVYRIMISSPTETS
jgi:hypothetical protein